MSKAISSQAKNVKKGAALLDKKKPGWYNSIDEKKLDAGEDCVLFQLYGSYVDGLKELKLNYYDSDYGFFVDPAANHERNGWGELTKLWKQAVKDRKNDKS